MCVPWHMRLSRSATMLCLLPCLIHRDEQNLEENERIKKELNPRKIGGR